MSAEAHIEMNEIEKDRPVTEIVAGNGAVETVDCLIRGCVDAENSEVLVERLPGELVRVTIPFEAGPDRAIPRRLT